MGLPVDCPDCIEIVKERSVTDPPLSEADLHAYADGGLAPRRAGRVGAYLVGRPAEARRIAFYGRLNAQIRSAFPINDEPLSRGAPRNSGRWRVWAARMLIVSVLGIAAACGWLAASVSASSDMLDDVALMALLEASSRADGQPAAPIAGFAAAAPDLSAEGLTLVSQEPVLSRPFSSGAGYVYVSRNGAPVVLLSAPALNVPPQPQWMARRVGAYRLLTWTSLTHRYVIAGAATTPGLMRAADVLTGARAPR